LIAQENEREARKQREEAERQREIAQEKEQYAKKQRKEAEKQKEIAQENEIKEQIQALVVDMNKEEANFRQYLAKSKELAVQSLAQKADTELKALLALTAYRLNREAFDTLEGATKEILGRLDRNRLDPGKKELVNKYRTAEKVYKTFQDKSKKMVVPPVLFRALREAYVAKEESGDIIYRDVESWALAASGNNTILFNNMEEELLSVSFSPQNVVLPVIDKKDTARLLESPMQAASLVQTEDRVFCGTADGRLVYREKNNRDVVKPLANHGAKILSMAFSTNKNRLFYSVENVIHRLNPGKTSGAEAVLRFDPGIFIRALTVIDTPGRSILIAADSKGNIFRAEVTDGTMERKPLNADLKPGGFYSIAWEPVRKMLVLGNSLGEIRLFSNIDRNTLASGGKIPSVTFETKHKGIIRALAFSADGRFLASGGYDGTVLLWDLKGKSDMEIARQEPVLTIPGKLKILSIVFVNNGETIVFSDSQYLRMCPTRPGPFYEILLKRKKRDFRPDEWMHYIGESIKQKELIMYPGE
jgi:WD40 repeat protein